ncbi:MAG: hypothetical protein M1826_007181 [Phylliscum demangeonii]|nr:MAG: hypothetical protein M1826_007181 [Phylliscum demangeonii]
MKLPGLMISVGHVISIIALVAPILGTPLRTPSSSPSLKARSDLPDADHLSVIQLQLKKKDPSLSAKDLRRIDKIEAVYQKYQRRVPGWLGWVQSGTRWAHEKAWQMRNPHKTPQAEADQSFVSCLKMDLPYPPSPREPVWPHSIQRCERVTHPSAQLRMMMKNAFYDDESPGVQSRPARSSAVYP